MGDDAVPYFRVFNPVLQSERFDPQGTFIRRYCPELQAFDNWAIHDPHHRAPLLVRQGVYPAPTVDLAASRRKAIVEFKKIKILKKINLLVKTSDCTHLISLVFNKSYFQYLGPVYPVE